jgi:hypothetical protein
VHFLLGKKLNLELYVEHLTCPVPFVLTTAVSSSLSLSLQYLLCVPNQALLFITAASSFTAEYAGSSFLQNIAKYVAEHMAWHHITGQGTFQK